MIFIEFPFFLQHSQAGTSVRYRCRHVNLVTKTNVPGEEEYLFAAYSTFEVRRVEWSANPTIDEPHIVELDAMVDNGREEEDLPLSPWY